MNQTVFLAGATGALGQSLLPHLLRDRWTVFGLTRTPEKAQALAQASVHPVVCDVYDREALVQHVTAAQPTVLLHLLTDLPFGLDRARMQTAVGSNARVRDEGTRNLVAAAAAAGVTRVIAESVAFAYAPGPRPYTEASPLNTSAEGPGGVSARGVHSLEQQVLAGPFTALVLRFGALYGPRTGFEQPWGPGPVHVEDAAKALHRALTRGEPGLYNIAEEDGTVSVARAAAQLGWRARHSAHGAAG